MLAVVATVLATTANAQDKRQPAQDEQARASQREIRTDSRDADTSFDGGGFINADSLSGADVGVDGLSADLGTLDQSGPFWGPSGPSNPPPPPVRTPVAVAMGDSYISGQGAGNYPRNGPDWNGSIEDPAFCDRSPDATIHVAYLPGIDETYNVSCSGATVLDITEDASGRAGLKSQVDQLLEIAGQHDKEVKLIQFSVGGNNRNFYFGKLLAACMGGFIFDGYTNTSLPGVFGDDQWYDWTLNHTELRQTECTADKMPAYPEGVQRATVGDLRQALVDVAASIGHNGLDSWMWDTAVFEYWTPPTFDDPADQAPYNALVAYINDLDTAWFNLESGEVPMMALPVPEALIATIDGWWNARGADAAQLNTAYHLRGVRLLHEWQHKVARTAWGDTSWSLSGSDIADALDSLGASMGIPAADRFPPIFQGQKIPYSQLYHAMWIPKQGPADTFIHGEAGPVADAVRALITGMSGIKDEYGVKRYPEGSYRIVMQDYVSPFAPTFDSTWRTANGKNDGDQLFENLVKLRYAAGCPIHEATAAWAADQALYLSQMTDLAAAAVRIDHPNSDITRLGVAEAFNGVRLCETPDPAHWQISPVRLWSMDSGLGRELLTSIQANWVWELKGKDKINTRCLYWSLHACQDSGHPDLEGNDSLGQCLSAAWTLNVDRVDCRRTGGAMWANAAPIPAAPVDPAISASLGTQTDSTVDLPSSGECDYSTFSVDINASVLNPDNFPGWSNPTWTLTASSSDPSFQVTSDAAAMEISGTAPCTSFGVYDVTVSVTATDAGGTLSTQFTDYVTIRGDHLGEF